MKFKIPREVKIGVIAVITLGLLFWGIDFLKGQNWFSTTNSYYIVYPKVDGLKESAEVHKDGYKIGQVSSVNYDHKLEGTLVKIDIENTFSLPMFTRAEIYSVDLMGNVAIRLDFGELKKNHPVGDTLIPAYELSLQERVSVEMLPIKRKAEELMGEMQQVLEVIKYVFNDRTRENLSKSFESIQATLANLENSSISLDTLMGRGEGKIVRILDNIASITGNLKDNNENLAKIIENFEGISDTLAKAKIASTLSNADRVLKQANIVFEKINSGEGTLGALIHNDSLYNNLNSTSAELDSLITKMNRNPREFLNINVFEHRTRRQKDIEKLDKEILKDERSGKSTPEELNKKKDDIKKLREGKYLSSADKPDQMNNDLTKGNGEIVFKVQIKSSKERIPKQSSELKGTDGVEELWINGWYKYAVGNYSNPVDAVKFQNLIRKDFPGAFIIALKGNEPISIQKAKQELNL